mmetsp:Transcript_8418/g.9455  ORF Transcript_8418/g.9455 Transcript_8418/m.9455 type:complete len:250 (-) Transcript_8418:59-808(-)
MRRTLTCLSSLTLASGKIYFSETFGSGWESRWTLSKWKESEGTQGKWAAASGKWFNDEAEDTGIQTSEDSKFFGISAGFDSFSNEGKELIIQYQAKYEKDVECGGGYVKIGPKMDDPTTFGDPTVYNIMFGPDKCGYTKRTHLIFNYKGKNVLKKSDLAYKQEGEGTSHVYRMVLKPGCPSSVPPTPHPPRRPSRRASSRRRRPCASPRPSRRASCPQDRRSWTRPTSRRASCRRGLGSPSASAPPSPP